MEEVVGQSSPRRRSGKVVQMESAVKDRPCEGLADAGFLLGFAERATSVRLTGAAADQLRELEAHTGQSSEVVLSMALGLLETLVTENQAGRQMMLVSRFGLPLRRVVLPS